MSLARNRYQLADVVYKDETVIAYRAHDATLNRAVVVETIAPGAALPDAAAQLIRKAQRVGQHNLPHIAALFNQYVEDDQSFVVWEDVPGQPISVLAPLQPSQAAEVIGIAAETAQAALARRSALPPLLASNVYIGSTGQVSITNLGLHQGATNNAEAVVALGFLLKEMLDDKGIPTALHTLAKQAVAGQIPSVDGFVANLRRAATTNGAPTMAIPRSVQTVDLNEPDVRQPAERAPAAAPLPPPQRQTTHTGTTMPIRVSQPGAQRRTRSSLPPRPGQPQRRSGGLGLVWALLALLALGAAAFFVVPRLGDLINTDSAAVATTATASPDDEPSTSPSAAASAVAVVPSVVPSPSASPSAAPSAVPSPSSVAGQYVVATTTGQNLSVRVGPGTSAERVGSLPNGTVVDVVGAGQDADGYTWVPIRTNDLEGWSILSGLQRQTVGATPAPSAAPSAPPSAAPTPPPSPTSAASAAPVPGGTGEQYIVATISGERLVVRAGPNLSSARVTSLPNGTVVEVLGGVQRGDGRDWLPIRAGSVEGWVVAGGVRPR